MTREQGHGSRFARMIFKSNMSNHSRQGNQQRDVLAPLARCLDATNMHIDCSAENANRMCSVVSPHLPFIVSDNCVSELSVRHQLLQFTLLSRLLRGAYGAPVACKRSVRNALLSDVQLELFLVRLWCRLTPSNLRQCIAHI